MPDRLATIHELTARGLSTDTAAAIATCLQTATPEDAWSRISREFLTPAHDFALHTFLYEQCYGENALLRATGPAWLPTPEIIARANVTAACRELALPDYPALHRWSVEHKADFWALAIRRLNIRFRQPYTQVMHAPDPTRPQWLPGARLNIVDSCFQADPSAPAILQSDGTAPIHTTTYAGLRTLTARAANALIAAGIAPADTVAMIAPMTAASVAAYLAVIAIGAAVVSIADSFAPEEIAARLRIANAKLIITQDAIHWGHKRLPLYEKIAAATNLPIIVINSRESDGQSPLANSQSAIGNWQSAIPSHPADPINILFSSGTTGEPKAIPWDHTTPIKAAADAHFHHDLHPGDVACWPTNLGWMMGPWLIFATLINRGAMALFAQTPIGRPFGQFVQDAHVSMLGCVPSLVRAWRQSACMHDLDWSRIRAFSSSGECSNPEDMLYLMHLAGYRPIIEYCGGTEIGGAYVTSTVVQPNIPAAFSTPALGLDLAIFDHGPPPTPAATGEVFIAGPSMGLSTRLLNRDHHAVYFDNTPVGPDGTPLRRHGDELESLPNGYFRVAGRSDDTMNLGGIKVACAEIERVLATLPQIQETAAVALPPPGGGPSRLIIFAVLRPTPPAIPGAPPPDPAALKSPMQHAIRTQLNPLFHIDTVHILPALPRTASNKILRRELRALTTPP